LDRPNFIFMHELVFPSAKDMGKLGYDKFKIAAFEDLAYFEPYYLKEFLISK